MVKQPKPSTHQKNTRTKTMMILVVKEAEKIPNNAHKSSPTTRLQKITKQQLFTIGITDGYQSP